MLSFSIYVLCLRRIGEGAVEYGFIIGNFATIMHETCGLNDLDKLRDLCLSISPGNGYKTFKGFNMNTSFQHYQEYINNLEVYDDDIWVTSVPKSGTTWLQEMVWCICNNLNFEAAKVDLNLRFQFIEFGSIFDMQDFNDTERAPEYLKNIPDLNTIKRPRFIKTHLPWDLLPEQIRTFKKRPKILHVIRNPKDVCVSYYHHCRLLFPLKANFETFTKLFLGQKLKYSPYDKNILSYWTRRLEPNLLLLRYEDMKNDLSRVIKNVSNFLNVDLNENQVQQLMQHLNFDAMKNNDAVNQSSLISFIKANNKSTNPNGSFIRSGICGSFKSEMSPDIIKNFDKWINDKFDDSNLKF